MTRREELQKRYAEYERKLDGLKEIAPENVVLKTGAGYGMEAVYTVQFDELKIVRRLSNGTSYEVSLSGDEAEKLYHFLGGLYGNENQGSCVQAEIQSGQL
jgi:hypothetical protein